jgi:predicted nucleic acid-binding protein
VILVDTSAWVEYDRATDSRVDRRLSELIETSDLVAVTEPVAMEVLAGARDDRRERDLGRLLRRFEATLLAHDADMDRVASVIGLRLDDASLRA